MPIKRVRSSSQVSHLQCYSTASAGTGILLEFPREANIRRSGNGNRVTQCPSGALGDKSSGEAEFYAMLKNAFSQQRPSTIIALDETCAHYSETPKTVLAPRGTKHVEVTVKNEKETSSALLWAYANVSYDDDGQYCPTTDIVGAHGTPLVIFKGTESDRTNSVKKHGNQ
eukprot:GILI01002283.1.p2 GENE.GILI01002283.1~~GILI01002283.1.p2  ORF type:complete len:170 (-),score=2.43 GILI01002283.1:421-930(-)